MNHKSPAPIDILNTAANELGMPLMVEKLMAQDAALTRIEQIAAEACGKQPATASAMKACDLLRHAAREREEVGYLPPETVDDAIGLARKARGHAERLMESREQSQSRSIR